MIPVISIVGSSNSRKTTLIERIIPMLKSKGYKVGAIKHDAHHFDIDHMGKDTWRMTASGADAVVISSSEKMAMLKRLNEEKSLNELVDWLFKDMDIVITEGYKAQDKPKIEVIRFKSLLTLPENNLIAVVDNTPSDYAYTGARLEKDIFPDKGSLSGLYTGLFQSMSEYGFVTACDMPFLNEKLIRHFLSYRGYDAVVPVVKGKYEPLFSLYSKSCLPVFKAHLEENNLRIQNCIQMLKVKSIKEDELRVLDSSLASLMNINTPEELRSIRNLRKESDSLTRNKPAILKKC